MRGSSVFRPVTSQSERLAATVGHPAPVFQFVRKPQMAAFALLDCCKSGGGVFLVAWHDALPVLEYEFQFGDWCYFMPNGVIRGKEIWFHPRHTGFFNRSEEDLCAAFLFRSRVPCRRRAQSPRRFRRTPCPPRTAGRDTPTHCRIDRLHSGMSRANEP